MMGQLERRTEAISGEFNSEAIANTLWAFARMGTKPGERMMGLLERRAEAISGEFNSHDIIQIMWFCAKSKCKPSETLLAGLEEKALGLTNSFKTHHLIMLFWAYVTLKLRPREDLWASLVTATSKAANTLTCQDVCTFLWSMAVGGAALDINTATYERMCARTDNLADLFDNEQQSMLIWTSVLLPVEHGVHTKRIMERDVLGILSEHAPPGTYSSTDMQPGPLDDCARLAETCIEGQDDFVGSVEFANFQVGDQCEVYSSIGQASGEPAWQAGGNLYSAL
jgi:hypothetical protein